MSQASGLDLAVAALGEALASTGVPFMLIGGLAVIARGVVRQTDDADATVWAPGLDLEGLLATLARHGLRPRVADAVELARRAQVILLRHEPTGSDVDLSLAWLPFEEEALARADLLDVGPARVPVATTEDLVIYKAVAWRDRDRGDIERLARLRGPEIDRRRVLRIVAEFAEILGEPERTDEVDRLLGDRST